MSIWGDPLLPGGGGSKVPLLSKASWDALTAAQKRAYGLVAIQVSNSGFDRGKLYSGADYEDVSDFLPYSIGEYISCFAHYGNFDPASLFWGTGTTPVTLSALASRYQSEDAVYFDSKSGSKKFGIALPSTTSDFTLYCVAKGLSYASGDVIILGSVYSWSSLKEIIIYHHSGTMWISSVYGSDVDLINTQGDYAAVAIRSASMNASWFAYGATPRKNVNYSHHGTEFTFGSYGSGNYSTDLAVKFIGMSAAAESDAAIEANLDHLAAVYGLN